MSFGKAAKWAGLVVLLGTATLGIYMMLSNENILRTASCSAANTQSLSFLAHEQSVPAVILDTDFAGDVDDVGALAILHAMADSGEATILGIALSSGNHYALRAIDTINTYYGRPDIPIGATWTPAVSISSRYTAALALDFPNDVEAPPNAITLYRQILAEQPDQSVTIVSIGFLTNLQRLLASEADGYSPLSGSELVADKVAVLVVMGGQYPDSDAHPDDREYNFALDGDAAYAVARRWPTPIVFSGFEVGEDIVTGAGLQEYTAQDNPVRTAYDLFNGGTGRSSWDLTAVHFAVRGTADVWQLCGPGFNEVTRNGSNEWVESSEQSHYYLRPTVSKSQIEAILDDLLLQMP